MKSLNVKISDKEMKMLVSYCEASERTRTDVTREALRKFFIQQKKENTLFYQPDLTKKKL